MSVSAATIHLTYSSPDDGSVILTNTTSESVNFTLPKTNLTLDIQDENRTFKVHIPTLDVENVPLVNLSTRNMSASSVDDISVPIGPGRTYEPKLAYAFKIENNDWINGTAFHAYGRWMARFDRITI